MNKQELAKILLIVSGTYQNFQSNDMTLKTWEAVLGYVSFKHAQKALFNYIQEGYQFAPTPGQIFQAVLTIKKEERRKQSFKELPLPEITEEQKQKNLKMLADLSKDLAEKKALRQ